MFSTDTLHWGELHEQVEANMPYVREVLTNERSLYRAWGPLDGLEFRMPTCGISCQVLEGLLNEYTEASVRRVMNHGLGPNLNERLGYDFYPGANHVVLEASYKDKKYIIDPTYSQYLQAFGVHYDLLEYGAELSDVYPAEEVITIPVDELGLVSDWLCDVVGQFWSTRTSSKSFMDFLSSESGKNTITNMPRSDLKRYFEAIYASSTLSPLD